MSFKNRNFLFIILVFNFLTGFSQSETTSISSANRLTTLPLDSLSNDFKTYSIDDYNYAIDTAIKMYKDSSQIHLKKRGVNIVASLAVSFRELVIHKKVDLDAKEVEALLERFEDENFYIEKPKVSRYIKLMNYLCKGEYSYVHHRLIDTRGYNILCVFLFLYFSIFLFSYSNQFNWKHQKQFRKITLFSIAFLVLLFIIFKCTCLNNIKDYSFYGIPV